jgi:SAM-dependent methyltransferase
MLICQEGIEHMKDQLAILEEFNRVLKPNGRLIITTPNISHLRAKVSYLLTESDLYKRMPSNELDGLWFSDENKMYFGHLFLINAQKLRSLMAIAGFRLNKIITVKASIGSLLLSFLYPLILLVNSYAYVRNVYLKDEYEISDKKQVFKEIFKLNIHPVTLFGKHIFWELRKDPESMLRVHRTEDGII